MNKKLHLTQLFFGCILVIMCSSYSLAAKKIQLPKDTILSSYIFDSSQKTCVDLITPIIASLADSTANPTIFNTNFWSITPVDIAKTISMDNRNIQLQWLRKGIATVCLNNATPVGDYNVTQGKQTCITIKVGDTLALDYKVQICDGQLPYMLSLQQIYNDNNFFGIFPTGSITLQDLGLGKQNYLGKTNQGSCVNDINVIYDTKPTKKIADLGVKFIPPGSTITILKRKFDYSYAGEKLHSVAYINNQNECESVYNFKLQHVDMQQRIESKTNTLYCNQPILMLEVIPTIQHLAYNGQGILSYQWSNGATTASITVDKAGLYAVTTTYSFPIDYKGAIITKSISNVETINITEDKLPKAEIIISNGNSYYYPQSPAHFAGDWSVIGGKIIESCSGQSIKVLWDSTVTEHKLCLKLYNDCGADSTCISFKLNKKVNLDENNTLKNISISPNPTENIVHIDDLTADIKDFSVSVVNMTGQLLSQTKDVRIVDMSNFPSGFYMVVIQRGNLSVRQRILKI